MDLLKIDTSQLERVVRQLIYDTKEVLLPYKESSKKSISDILDFNDKVRGKLDKLQDIESKIQLTMDLKDRITKSIDKIDSFSSRFSAIEEVIYNINMKIESLEAKDIEIEERMKRKNKVIKRAIRDKNIDSLNAKVLHLEKENEGCRNNYENLLNEIQNIHEKLKSPSLLQKEVVYQYKSDADKTIKHQDNIETENYIQDKMKNKEDYLLDTPHEIANPGHKTNRPNTQMARQLEYENLSDHDSLIEIAKDREIYSQHTTNRKSNYKSIQENTEGKNRINKNLDIESSLDVAFDKNDRSNQNRVKNTKIKTHDHKNKDISNTSSVKNMHSSIDNTRYDQLSKEIESLSKDMSNFKNVIDNLDFTIYERIMSLLKSSDMSSNYQIEKEMIPQLSKEDHEMLEENKHSLLQFATQIDPSHPDFVEKPRERPTKNTPEKPLSTRITLLDTGNQDFLKSLAARLYNIEKQISLRIEDEDLSSGENTLTNQKLTFYIDKCKKNYKENTIEMSVIRTKLDKMYRSIEDLKVSIENTKIEIKTEIADTNLRTSTPDPNIKILEAKLAEQEDLLSKIFSIEEEPISQPSQQLVPEIEQESEKDPVPGRLFGMVKNHEAYIRSLQKQMRILQGNLQRTAATLKKEKEEDMKKNLDDLQHLQNRLTDVMAKVEEGNRLSKKDFQLITELSQIVETKTDKQDMTSKVDKQELKKAYKLLSSRIINLQYELKKAKESIVVPPKHGEKILFKAKEDSECLACGQELPKAQTHREWKPKGNFPQQSNPRFGAGFSRIVPMIPEFVDSHSRNMSESNLPKSVFPSEFKTSKNLKPIHLKPLKD